MHLSIRSKLLAAILGTTVLMTLACAVTLFQFRAAVATFATDVASTDTAALHASQLLSEFQLQQHDLQELLLRGSDPALYREYLSAFEADGAGVVKGFDALKIEVGAIGDSRARTNLDAFTAGYKNYNDAVASTLPLLTSPAGFNQTGADATMNGEDQVAHAALTDLSAELNALAASRAAAQTDGAARMIAAMMAMIAAAFALAFGLAVFVSRRIAADAKRVLSLVQSVAGNEIAAMEAGLSALAANDLTFCPVPQTVPIPNPGSDEIGQTATAANSMLEKIDATMASYQTARMNLTTALRTVKEAAASVTAASREMNAATDQAGGATNQIAGTIVQVAAGASQQAEASSATWVLVRELTTVADEVRSGAMETSAKVNAASNSLTEMAAAIAQTSQASDEVARRTEATAAAADNGRLAVRQTVEGMGRIKTAVEEASIKVTELGAKDDQIGAIVETIDDIAEQTNLLALNAAIEAARAGEQGRGFAVVADEVRKLAERSSRATKEIAALVAQVQQGSQEAVSAMQIGAREVVEGAELAGRSGAALAEIDGAVNATRAAVANISIAVGAMRESSAGVMSATDSIAAIASTTSGVAGRMAGSIAAAGMSMESIAAISEENSASAEEVSAATEQMSGQVQEVVAAAAKLTQMAAGLDALVAQFQLDTAHRSTGSYEPPSLRHVA
ncbi:MAG: methyl-accepting chemotaxis protein [Candidatus Limnocylindrales bacterium]